MKKLLAVSLVCIGSFSLAARAAEAKSNWEDNCEKCHGSDGKGEKGDKPIGKKLHIADFTDASVQAKFTDAQAFAAIKEGLQDQNGKTRMKAIEGLSDDEITALVKYVRGLAKQ
jgi:mono/diheme cytochrome c family protein